jgi:hypothetical protein
MNRRPRVLRGGFDESSRDGVLADVLERSGEMVVAVDHPRGEASAPEMAMAAVPAVETLRVAAVEVLHPARELLLRGLDDQVVVRAHEAHRVHAPAVAVHALFEEPHERITVGIVAEDECAEDATRRYVEETVRERGSQHARHDATVVVGHRRNRHDAAEVTLLFQMPCRSRTGPRV